MMRQFIIPYLMFKNSLEAANYYKEIFNGEIENIMYGNDLPGSKPDEIDKVMHLELKINGQYLYLFDGDLPPTSQTTLLLDYKNFEDLKKAYIKMANDGRIIQELSDMFWNAKYAVVEDKFGMKWDFHYMKPKQ